MNWFFNPCRRYRRSICLLASGVLSEVERKVINNHLSACVDCRKYHEEMRAVTAPLVNWTGAVTRIQPSQAAQNRWTEAVLAAARIEPVRRHTLAENFPGWWREVIWPYRHSWSTLTVIWVAILLGNLSLRDHSPTVMVKSSPASQEMIMAFKDRQKILAELLMDHSALNEADRQKHFSPKPRTERVKVLTA